MSWLTPLPSRLANWVAASRQKYPLWGLAATPEPCRIAETDDWRITLHAQPRRSSQVLITFDGYGTDKSDAGFGTAFARKYRIDHIYVSQRKHSQYQGLSQKDFADIVRPVIGWRRTMTYGISLGGYCALFYGGAIGADVLALSPRNSIHPAIQGRDWLHPDVRKQPLLHPAIWPKPKAPGRITVLLDPRLETDVMFFDQVVAPTFPRLRRIDIPYGGHELAVTLQRAGMLGRVVLAALARRRFEIDLTDANSEIVNVEHAREAIQRGELAGAVPYLLAAIRLGALTEPQKLLARIYHELADPPDLTPRPFAHLRKLALTAELFDPQMYLEENPDIAGHPLTVADPFLHYILLGAFEGRRAAKGFHQPVYLKRYPDLKSRMIHPFVHFLLNGQQEGRRGT